MSTEIQRRIDNQRAEKTLARSRAYHAQLAANSPVIDYDDGLGSLWTPAAKPITGRTEQPAAISTPAPPTAEELAGLLLAPATVYGELTAQVYEQVGDPRAARRLLAEAHHVAANRLLADAA